MTFTNDSKNTASLSLDSKNTGTFTNDTISVGISLWVSSTFPWQLQFPWRVSNDGFIFNYDTKS